MPETIASSILTGLAVEAIKALMKLVIARSYDEIKLVTWSFEDQLLKLKSKLVYIEAFLEDVSNVKHQQESQLVNNWLQNVKDAVYFADEVMDDYALEIHRKRKLDLKSRLASKISNLKTKPLGFHYDMSRKVRRVLSMFDELDKEAHSIGLKPVQIAREELASCLSFESDLSANLYQVRKHASASSSEFVGRKFDEQKLLRKICNPEINEVDLSIIAIVGIGGLGKTTLARRVYEHEQVDRHFDKKKVWICVSQQFNVVILLKEMVESLTSRKCDLSNTGAIIDELQKELKGKKFMLVLDDVWNNKLELWESLRNELRRIGNVAGSVILVTTRSIEVAEKARAVYAHKLEGLSEDDGWALLKQKISFENLPSFSSLEEIGKKIVRKCKGVPLAIRAIRGILQSKVNHCEWESIERSELWDLPEDDENYIMPSLLLSFNHLPFLSLKQCFSYCAIFPKDELMEKSQLVSLWLAQGFLHESEKRGLRSRSMEDIGERYLQILLNNSFLQEERVDNTSGQQRFYKMHDLVHDLAVYISREDLLVWRSEAKPNGIAFRHCVLNFNEARIRCKDIEGIMLHKLRTISFVGGNPTWDLLMSARYMRTLIISKIGLEKVPSEIEQLRNLFYIDLSENPIKRLPDSLCKLYRLQTLRLLGCNMLKKLPADIQKLINLRHVLTSSFVLAPKGLQQLTSLQTLPWVKLSAGREGWTIDELGSLHELRGEVCIAGLEHVMRKEDARKADLRTKSKILKLSLIWNRDRERSSAIDEDVLDVLEPHPSIISLKLEHFNGVSFPLWIMKMAVKQECKPTSVPLSNVSVVELVSCKRCKQLPTLGHLPFLKLLSLQGLEGVSSIGYEFYVNEHNISMYQSRSRSSSSNSNGSNNSSTIVTDHLHVSAKVIVVFPALRELKIDDLPSLEEWLSPPPALMDTTFPCLETLKVVNCPRLCSIPSLHFQSLRNLEVGKLAGSQPLDIIKGNNAHLTWLTVSVMLKMTSLPSELSICTNLQYLKLTNCGKLKSIPSGLKSLVSLEVWSCRALKCLAEDLFHGLSCLREVSIWGCEALTRIPTSLQKCTQIEDLRIEDCPLIDGPVPNLSTLKGLVNLTIVRSGKLMTSVLHSIQYLDRLRKLELGGFSDINPFVTFKNHSLKHLTFKGCSKFKALPEQLEQPCFLPSLKFMNIENFCDMKVIPDWIGNLSSLEELWLRKCEKLKYLPSKQAMQKLTQLHSLYIYVCPLLRARCSKNCDGEWAKVSQISYIQIDSENVQDLRS